MDRLLDIAREFNVFEEIQLSTEKVFKLRKFKFESKNPVFANMLKQLFEENAMIEIFIFMVKDQLAEDSLLRYYTQQMIIHAKISHM